MRAIGGTLYLTGALILVYNIIVTIRSGSKVEDELAEAPALQRISNSRRVQEKAGIQWLERKPVKLTIYATNSHFYWWYCAN